MRTSKKEVHAVFIRWLNFINGREAENYNDIGGYRLDHNSVYGGWRVEQICNEHGGVRDVFNYRLPSWEFVTALRMCIVTIEERHHNPKVSK